MHGLWSMAFTWRVEEGGKEDLSHDENVQSGQMWVQLFWECSFEKGLKGGKEKGKTFYLSFIH